MLFTLVFVTAFAGVAQAQDAAKPAYCAPMEAGLRSYHAEYAPKALNRAELIDRAVQDFGAKAKRFARLVSGNPALRKSLGEFFARTKDLSGDFYAESVYSQAISAPVLAAAAPALKSGQAAFGFQKRPPLAPTSEKKEEKKDLMAVDTQEIPSPSIDAIGDYDYATTSLDILGAEVLIKACRHFRLVRSLSEYEACISIPITPDFKLGEARKPVFLKLNDMGFDLLATPELKLGDFLAEKLPRECTYGLDVAAVNDAASAADKPGASVVAAGSAETQAGQRASAAPN